MSDLKHSEISEIIENNKNLETVEINTNFVLKDEKRELILSKLREHKFFEFISSIETDIIRSCIEDLESTRIMMRNITDEYDDELQLVNFSWIFSDFPSNNTIKIEAKNIDVDDEDTLNEYFYVDFHEFIIEIKDSELKFKMSYDKNKHPAFLIQIIKKCFRILFERLNDYINK